MRQYLNLLQHIIDNGTIHTNRTGIDTIAVFGHQERFNLQDGFPATTTKKLAWKSVVSELLWFLEGSGDERRLAEIRYGEDRSKLADKKTIWSANADADYWKDKAKFPGDLGQVYGRQWRHWRYAEGLKINHSIQSDYPAYDIRWGEVDQIKEIIRKIKHDPNDRRMILSAWNVGELDQMALPPCHLLAQFNVRNDEYLDCQLYQRSCDAFLGIPFNIASYALLTEMMAQVTGLKAGDFIHTFGDLHIYTNHLDQVHLQLERDPLPLPKLGLTKDITSIDSFHMKDIWLENYESHPAIKADMAV